MAVFKAVILINALYTRPDSQLADVPLVEQQIWITAEREGSRESSAALIQDSCTPYLQHAIKHEPRVFPVYSEYSRVILYAFIRLSVLYPI